LHTRLLLENETVDLGNVNKLDADFTRELDRIPQIRRNLGATGAVTCIGRIGGKPSPPIVPCPDSVAERGRFPCLVVNA
jgi:hypothetical protein